MTTPEVAFLGIFSGLGLWLRLWPLIGIAGVACVLFGIDNLDDVKWGITLMIIGFWQIYRAIDQGWKER